MVTAHTVFDASLAALGSPDAVAAIQTISSLADCTSPRGTYTTEIHSGRGRRVWFKQTWPDRAPTSIVINRQGAWVTDLDKAVAEVLDAGSVSMIRAHEFQMIPLALGERYTNGHAVARADWHGVECTVIRARDDLDMPADLYFRTSDDRWAGMLLANQRQPDETVRVVINDWLRVADVFLPSFVTATDSTGDFVLEFKHIAVNRVDEKIFNTPPSVIGALHGPAV